MGAIPRRGVIRDPAGNLYGTAAGGSCWVENGCGVVYKLDSAGNETVLYNFTGGADGLDPEAGVIRDPAGNLYGTTDGGGAAGAGVVFKVNAEGHETVLYSFKNGADGGYPLAGVIRDSAGNLYGTAAGVVYKLDAAGNYAVLHSFTGGAPLPYGGVVRDAAGNLYGTTRGGWNGTNCDGGCGVVYKLDSAGNETVLYTFTSGFEAEFPEPGLTLDSAGNLYGTTFSGGTAGAGVVFEVTATGHQTVLYSFPDSAGGQEPSASVIGDGAGNLYGTSSGGTSAAGVLYRLSKGGRETVLHTFTGGADGGSPQGVIRDSDGNLYGTAAYGGSSGWGLVYKLDSAGNYTVLHNFTGADGLFPSSGVIRDSAGNLYGTTKEGGSGYWGVVYKLDPAGNVTVLYNFTGGDDGRFPLGGVIRDPAGNLYGTTQYDSDSGYGVIYKVDTTGHETVLYTFWGGLDGGSPLAGVIRDPAGNLYGTTNYPRAVVYKLDKSGHLTVLHTFSCPDVEDCSDGGSPIGGLIRDSAGNLYGTASVGGSSASCCSGSGVVYKLDSAGNYTVLCNFTGGTDGGYPLAGLIRDSTGNLYGTTYYGGIANEGVVFKIKP